MRRALRHEISTSTRWPSTTSVEWKTAKVTELWMRAARQPRTVPSVAFGRKAKFCEQPTHGRHGERMGPESMILSK